MFTLWYGLRILLARIVYIRAAARAVFPSHHARNSTTSGRKLHAEALNWPEDEGNCGASDIVVYHASLSLQNIPRNSSYYFSSPRTWVIKRLSNWIDVQPRVTVPTCSFFFSLELVAFIRQFQRAHGNLSSDDSSKMLLGTCFHDTSEIQPNVCRSSHFSRTHTHTLPASFSHRAPFTQSIVDITISFHSSLTGNQLASLDLSFALFVHHSITRFTHHTLIYFNSSPVNLHYSFL